MRRQVPNQAAWIAPARREAARVAALAVLAAGAGVCLALNLPGHFSYDSVVQLAEGRTRSYGGEHPPVMSWLLGLADWVEPGAAPFVVFDVALVYAALAGFVLATPRVSWLAAALAAALVALPQLLIYPAVVWKDVLFAGAAVAGFAALAGAGRLWTSLRWRAASLLSALVLLSLATLARQNGAVVLPFAALAVGWIAAKRGVSGPRSLASGLAFLAIAGLVVLGGSAALATRLETGSALADSWEALETYDIVAAAAREPGLDLAVLAKRAPWLERQVRVNGVRAYSPERIDTLDPLLAAYAGRGDVHGLIFDQWRELILRHPWLYLRVRWSAFRWVLTQPRPLDCVLIETGVDGPAGEMAVAGLKERDTQRDDALAAYAMRFAGTPAYAHAGYGLVGALILVFLLRRRRAEDIAAAAMLGAAFAFAASFALISIACDYRYLYALDLAVIAAALYVAASAGVARSQAPADR